MNLELGNLVQVTCISLNLSLSNSPDFVLDLGFTGGNEKEHAYETELNYLSPIDYGRKIC